MTPIAWIILFFVVGVALFFAELFLPTHGLLGLLGLLCVGASVWCCFHVDRWLGVGALAAAVIAAPFALQGLIQIWQKTPVGKAMVLTAVAGGDGAPRVATLIGATGVAVSELRPMGECDFGPERVQCRSETGNPIPAGAAVRLIDLKDTVAVVRPV